MYGRENPQFGSVHVYNAVNDHVQSRFEDIATRAGIATDCPENVRPLEFWIHCLWQDLLRNRNSSEYFAGSTEGGTVTDVIASSASYCLRLATAAEEVEHRARVQRIAAISRQGAAEGRMSSSNEPSNAAEPDLVQETARIILKREQRKCIGKNPWHPGEGILDCDRRTGENIHLSVK